MMCFQKKYRADEWVKAALFVFMMTGCALKPIRYCSESGQPAREHSPVDPIGNKRCSIKKDAQGQVIKDGPYLEWFPNGEPALLGEYSDGKKSGKWIEWDASGNKISERWFEDGRETPTRDLSEVKPVSTIQTQQPGRRLPSGYQQLHQ